MLLYPLAAPDCRKPLVKLFFELIFGQKLANFFAKITPKILKNGVIFVDCRSFDNFLKTGS